ncbi:hypothetical protein Tco_0157553 [Tanacetum coccineum]
MERAATTASSLEAEQDSEAQTRFEAASKQSNDPPLSRVNTLRSGEDSMKLKELMELCTMVCLPYYDQHNIVALLEKTDGSEGFHQIVDFLNASHIRKYLQLADAGGLSSLPNTKIFDQLLLMGYAITSDKLTFQKDPVADEAAFTGVDVVHGGAATTISSIDVGHGSGNITKSPTMPYDSPLPGGHTPGSDEGSMALHELTVLCTNLSNKVESLEIELKQTKLTYGAAFTKLIKKVKKLEQTVKTSQARRRTKIIASDEEEDLVAEDPSKQGRSMIEEIVLDARILLVPPHVEVRGELNTASTFVSTASPQRHADTIADDLTLAETLMKIIKSAVKAKGKAKMDETDKKTENGSSASSCSGFTDVEWDDVLARVAADEDFVQQLQAGEKCSEEDLPMKLVELVNQRKKFFAQQRAEAKRNKPMTPAQHKEYISNYIKNQEGGYSIKQLKSLSFEQVKEIFETTMRKVQSFVPIGSELEVQRLKRAGQEVLEEPVKTQKIREASGSGEESAEKEKRIIRRRTTEIIFAKMLKKFDRDDLVKLWDLVKKRFSTTEPTDDKEKEL